MNTFTVPTQTNRRSFALPQLKTIFSKKKIGTYVFVFIVLIGILIGLRMAFARSNAANLQTGTAVSANTLTTEINREFLIPGYDESKKLGSPIKYTLTNAQLTKEIIIKGQKAKAVAGRAFLIVNLKLVNEYNQSLFLNTRNYVRVQAVGSQDKLAPEIHNDTVEVQPLSTKITRIGLPVNESEKQFVLFVGEIEGQKQEIPISF